MRIVDHLDATVECLFLAQRRHSFPRRSTGDTLKKATLPGGFPSAITPPHACVRRLASASTSRSDLPRVSFATPTHTIEITAAATRYSAIGVDE